MNGLRGVVIAAAIAVSAMLIVGCDRGPFQKAGAGVDQAVAELKR